MNKPTFLPVRRIIAGALIAMTSLTIAACDSNPAVSLDAAATEGVVLEGSTIGGPWELVKAGGDIVKSSDFDGQYRIIYFGYTYCPDVCPLDAQKIGQAMKLFAEDEPELAKQIQPIFITIDPERDTPEHAAEFAANFHQRMLGLSGTPEQVAAAADPFKVSYSKGEEMSDGQYLVAHTNLVYLMGKQGEPLVALPVDLGPEAMVRDMKRWVS